VLRALHTMSGRGPGRRSTAGDGAVPHRSAHPLDHLSEIGPGPLVQIRPTPPSQKFAGGGGIGALQMDRVSVH